MRLAEQPAGLQDLADDELRIWLADRRAGLARVEHDKTGRSSKARRGWTDVVAAAEAQIERRRT
jgi:hypothetical protein